MKSSNLILRQGFARGFVGGSEVSHQTVNTNVLEFF